MDAIFGFLNDAVSAIGNMWWVGLVLLALALFVPPIQKALLSVFGIRLVAEDSLGVVNARFILFRKFKTLPDGKIIALRGEAGYQADTLAPGVHFFLWPWQFEVDMTKFIRIPEGKIGIVEAVDGTAIPAGRVLGKRVECDTFQSARAFLDNGGERGPQLTAMPPGVYRINSALFKVNIVDAIRIPEGEVGIVTTLEGTPLPTGEIAGREIDGHRRYQDPQAFVDAGGFKGLQEQVILAGTYYINPYFAVIERVRMTEVPIGEVGVVVAYVGLQTPETDATDFKHGNIVEQGFKGVWHKPLDPGKYAINPKTHKVEMVPTTNIVLNWADSKNASHALDSNLSTITVRSADGFTFNLDVSQIIHVSRDKASSVIARFGSMKNLVSQVLEPLIGNYFRNSAQASDAIDFLQQRETRQKEAKAHIDSALNQYDVQAVDSLIGDIVPPEELMRTLTERKVAERLEETYKAQEKAEVQRNEFMRAKAEADTRERVVNAQRGVEVSKLDAEAAVNQAGGEAESKKIIANADAHVLEVTGDAQAKNTLAVGQAEATVLKQKVDAVGAEQYGLMAVVKDLAENKIELVPEVLVQGGEGGGNVSDALLALIARGMARKDEPITPPDATPKVVEEVVQAA